MYTGVNCCCRSLSLSLSLFLSPPLASCAPPARCQPALESLPPLLAPLLSDPSSFTLARCKLLLPQLQLLPCVSLPSASRLSPSPAPQPVCFLLRILHPSTHTPHYSPLSPVPICPGHHGILSLPCCLTPSSLLSPAKPAAGKLMLSIPLCSPPLLPLVSIPL